MVSEGNERIRTRRWPALRISFSLEFQRVPHSHGFYQPPAGVRADFRVSRRQLDKFPVVIVLHYIYSSLLP